MYLGLQVSCAEPRTLKGRLDGVQAELRTWQNHRSKRQEKYEILKVSFINKHITSSEH